MVSSGDCIAVSLTVITITDNQLQQPFLHTLHLCDLHRLHLSSLLELMVVAFTMLLMFKSTT